MTDPVPLSGLLPLIGGAAAEIDLVPALVLAAILLSFSAMFSASETAIFSLQATDREHLKREGLPGALVEALRSDKRRTLPSILIGNELVNISLAAVFASLILTLSPTQPWLNLFVATPLLIIFGEVTPKTLAMANPRRAALFLARPLTFWSLMITPARWFLMLIADFFTRIFGVDTSPRSEVMQEDEVRQLIDQGSKAGAIGVNERALIDRLFDFSDTTVSRLMTPRPDIIAFPINTPLERLIDELQRSRVSRVPIYQGRIDNILGLLLTKDLLRFKGQVTPGSGELRALLQEAFYVPASKRAADMLKEFQKRRSHMAIVVDEHGSVVGLVTLDDLLGELVGELLDEQDEDSHDAVPVGHGVWTVIGSMDVDDFQERVGILLPEGEYHTVGGFILDRVGHIPEKGERVIHEAHVFEVIGVDHRRITKVSVRPLEPVEGEEVQT